MAELSEEIPAEPGFPPAPPPGHPHVASVIDEFMGWLRGRVKEGSKAQKTFDWYDKYLTSFLRCLRDLEAPPPDVPTLTVDLLEPAHVYRWVDSQAGWKTGKRGAMIAVQRLQLGRKGRAAQVGRRQVTPGVPGKAPAGPPGETRQRGGISRGSGPP